MSFVTLKKKQFCHNLSFQFGHNLSFFSFVTIWVLSRLEFLSFFTRGTRYCWAWRITDAKHTWSNFCWNLFGSYFFFTIMKEYVLVLRKFLLIDLKKKSNLCKFVNIVNICWSKPNNPSHFDWQITVWEWSFCLQKHS